MIEIWRNGSKDVVLRHIRRPDTGEEKDLELVRDIVSRVGLGDVEAFGMTWEDCEDFLSRLGYRLSVKVSETQAVA